MFYYSTATCTTLQLFRTPAVKIFKQMLIKSVKAG